MKNYYKNVGLVTIPSTSKIILSRLAFPILCLLSREQSLRIGLTPIDDERVVAALKVAQGRVLDIGCGANNFVRSYGSGVGVDVANWEGCDQVIKDAAKLPFNNHSFDTVSFLACLNHIPNRDKAIKEAYRVLKPRGKIIITMINPRLGTFVHWLRSKNDPDNQVRHIKKNEELLGMSEKQIKEIIVKTGFKKYKRNRFVYGLNNIYTAEK